MSASLLAGRKLTPMLRQYFDAKSAQPDAILMFRMGDFFELFFDDAKIAAELLDITLTARDKSDNPIPMAGVPHHAARGYIGRLVAAGHTVAVCDQVEDPKFAKGIVRREITQVVTPGTVCDMDALDPGANHYLAWATPADGGGWLLCLLDVLAGEVVVAPAGEGGLGDACRRMGVREVLTDPEVSDQARAAFGAASLPLRTPEGLVPVDAAKRFGDTVMTPLEARYPGVGRALGLLVAFAESTQRRPLPHLAAPRLMRPEAHVVLDEATRRNLELAQAGPDGKKHGSLLWHLDQCRTALGSRTLREWLFFPLRSADAIEARLDAVQALLTDRDRRGELRESLRGVRDLERLAGRVALQRATPRDLGALRASLAALPALKKSLADVPGVLGERWSAVDVCSDLLEVLERALVEDPPTTTADAGVFALGYNEELDGWIRLATSGHDVLADLERRERERTGISTLKVRFNRVFGYYIEIGRVHANKVPDDYVRKQTLVNAERYITAELKDHEEKVLQADDRRRRAEQALFAELLTLVGGRVRPLRRLARLVGATDAIQSLAEVADVNRYTRPMLSDAPVLDLKAARHPVVERLLPGAERFVPSDLSLDTESRQLMILTGPNMAGKSTVMRQAALCTLLAHMGSFVPAESAVVGLCDRIFTRVGASDNLGQGQSTFMVEMLETATILKSASPASLVLLDEIGRGTSTYDGVAIAWAVAEDLHDRVGCRTLFATHYHELTALAAERPRICNAHVAVAETGGEIVFLRRLLDGPSNRSYGVQVARLAALPRDVLKRAGQILGSLEASEGPVPAEDAAPSATRPPSDPLRTELQGLDPLQLSPMQALATLERLCKASRVMDDGMAA